jgi:hypothetical protein
VRRRREVRAEAARQRRTSMGRSLGSGGGASVRVTAWRPAWTWAAGIGVEASRAGRQWHRAAAASGSDPKRGRGKNCSR